jgi:hypothetical protein
MLTSFIDNQYLAVQIEESVQTWIALRPILHLL